MPGTRPDLVGLEPVLLQSPHRVPGTANSTPLVPRASAEQRHGTPSDQRFTAESPSIAVGAGTTQTFHLPGSLSTPACLNRTTTSSPGVQWPAAPPGLTRQAAAAFTRRTPALSSPPALELPAIPFAVQNKSSSSTGSPARVGSRPAFPRRLSRSSNFLDPTTEDDEKDPEDRSHASDDSKPTSASSDADFSVLNQRASMATGTDRQQIELPVLVDGHPRSISVSASEMSISDNSKEVNRSVSEHDDSLGTILRRAHEACLQAEVALASSKRALEVAMRRLKNSGKTARQGRNASKATKSTRLKELPRDKPSLTVLSRSRASTCQRSDSCSSSSSQNVPHQAFKSSLITQASVNESQDVPTDLTGHLSHKGKSSPDDPRDSALISFISAQDDSSADQENTSEDDVNCHRRRTSSMRAITNHYRTSADPQHSSDHGSVPTLPSASPAQPILGLIEDIAQRPSSSAVPPSSAFSSSTPSETSSDEPFSPIVSSDTGLQLYEHQNKHIRESRSGNIIRSSPSPEQSTAAGGDSQEPTEDPDAIALAPTNAVAPLPWSKSPDSYDSPYSADHCPVEKAYTSDAQVVSNVSALIDEGQVIPPNLMDASGEYLILETNEKVKLVDIPAPEPQRPLSTHRESFSLRGHVSLERISEEIDYESLAQNTCNHIDPSDAINTVNEVTEADEMKDGLVGKETSPLEDTFTSAPGAGYEENENEDGKEILQNSSSSQEAEVPLLLRTPTRSISLDSGGAVQAKSAGTDFPQVGETPRSTQVLSSLIGDHLTFVQSQQNSCSSATLAHRRSLDSSPTQSTQNAALARRERLIHSLSSSLKDVGDAVNDTIQQLEQQAESLHEQKIESTVEERFENSDLSMNRLVQSHWSSETSQFDISDSGLGFQLRSDLTDRFGLPGHTPLNQSADGSLLDVSDSGLGVCDSAASLFGLRSHPDRDLHHDRSKLKGIGEKRYIQLSSQSVTLSAPSVASSALTASATTTDKETSIVGHPVPDKSRSPSTSTSEGAGHNSNAGHPHAQASTDEGHVALLSKSDAGSSKATTEHEGRSISRTHGRSRTTSQSSSHGGSSSLRAKLSRAFFVDRSRGGKNESTKGNAEVSLSSGSPSCQRKKKLVVNIARANSMRPSDTLAVNSTPDYSVAPASPRRFGRTIGRAATVVTRKSEPKLTSNEQEKERVPAAGPSSPQSRTVMLSHRLFERVRRDPTTTNDAPRVATHAQWDARPQVAAPRPHVESLDSPRYTMVRSPSAPLERRRGHEDFHVGGQDKGKSRAISPDNGHAMVPGRPNNQGAPLQVQSHKPLPLDTNTKDPQATRQHFSRPAVGNSRASTASSAGGAAGSPAVRPSVLTKSQDVESNSEGEGLDYHTVDGGSMSSPSRRDSQALTITKLDDDREAARLSHEEGTRAVSARSSLATITLSPKVSLSDLSFDSPPSFPNLATSLTASGGKRAHGRLRPAQGEDNLEENASDAEQEEEEVTAEVARERARKRFQEWLENQARVRRY